MTPQMIEPRCEKAGELCEYASVTIIVILRATPRRAKFAKLHRSTKTPKSEKYQYPDPSNLSTYEASTSLTIEHSNNLLCTAHTMSRPVSSGVTRRVNAAHRTPSLAESSVPLISNDLHFLWDTSSHPSYESTAAASRPHGYGISVDVSCYPCRPLALLHYPHPSPFQLLCTTAIARNYYQNPFLKVEINPWVHDPRLGLEPLASFFGWISMHESTGCRDPRHEKGWKALWLRQLLGSRMYVLCLASSLCTRNGQWDGNRRKVREQC